MTWLRALKKRHAEVIIKNCASGGMRIDFEILSVTEIHSTSDQQDALQHTAFAAAAAASVLSE